MKETSGSFGCVATEATAFYGSLQPAKSGVRAASTTAMAAGDARSPDMEGIIPKIEGIDANQRSACRCWSGVVRAPEDKNALLRRNMAVCHSRLAR
jgi:hypothetical protein